MSWESVTTEQSGGIWIFDVLFYHAVWLHLETYIFVFVLNYRVDFEEGEGKVVIGNSVSSNTLEEIPKANSDDLVFLQESPNYCLENNTTGKNSKSDLGT